MKKRHLRLVGPDMVNCTKRAIFREHWECFKDNVLCRLISKREKIYTLKDFLIKIYRDYEITTGISEVPYYVRAEMKISKIIQENKVDYYYNLFKKFRKDRLI